MTTKQQERDALTKIRKIVEALGDDSYIATAFTGVFSTAEQNIEFDAAFSLAEELALAREDEKGAKAEADCLRAENKRLTEETEAAKAGRLHLEACYHTEQKCCAEQRLSLHDAENALEAAQREILTLKAKLYDLTIAGA